IPSLYKALGIYLPLITTNCAVLGVVTLNVQEGYGFVAAMVNALGSGLGYMLAMIMFSGIRERMEGNDVPKFWQGLPITLVAAALVTCTFLGFTGVIENMFGA
ncbi:MAG: electron transport complex protein RnfA, partial [Clostridia bacterium]|nr:electron transport complex protein RnfA [Clostridia bacterium]